MGQPKIDSANVPIGVHWLRQWRRLDSVRFGAPYWWALAANVGWQNVPGISKAFTLPEVSDVRVMATSYVECQHGAGGAYKLFGRVTMDAAAPVDYVQQITSCHQFDAFVWYYNVPAFIYTWTGVAVGAHTLQYDIAHTWIMATRKLWYPCLEIDICKA